MCWWLQIALIGLRIGTSGVLSWTQYRIYAFQNACSFIPNRGSSSFLRRIVLFGVEALWAVSRPQSQARLFSHASRPALGPKQPPVQTAQRKSCREVKLTTHFHLVPRFRMHGATPPHSEIYGLLVCDDALSSRRRLPVFPSSLLPPRWQVLTKHWYCTNHPGHMPSHLRTV
jgi:hypothetical protein